MKKIFASFIMLLLFSCYICAYVDIFGREANRYNTILAEIINTELSVSTINAKDSNGLYLLDDGGNLGIYIEDLGYVGVGTSNPSELLHVYGGSIKQEGNYDGVLRLDSQTDPTGNPEVYFNSNGASYIYDGILGISTSNPLATLEVVGITKTTSLNTTWITSSSNSDIFIVPNGTGYTRIGDASVSTHSLNTNDDLFVSGRIEVDGSAYFDGTLNSQAISIAVDKDFTQSASVVGSLRMGTTIQTLNTPIFHTGTNSNSFLMVEWADRNFNFAHTLQTNPTLFIHSANQATDEWIALYHDQTDSVIETGKGNVHVSGNLQCDDIIIDNNAYGSLTVSYNATATALTQNTYQTVTVNVLEGTVTKNISYTSTGADPGDTYLTVAKAGVYDIAADISMTGSINNVIHGGISINDAQPAGHAEFNKKLITASAEENAGCSGIFSLSANDTIRLKIENTSSNDDVVISHLNLSVVRIGQ